MQIEPTRIILPLGGELLYDTHVAPGSLVIDLDHSYTFEVNMHGMKYTAQGTRCAFYDAQSGIARLYPELVTYVTVPFPFGLKSTKEMG